MEKLENIAHIQDTLFGKVILCRDEGEPVAVKVVNLRYADARRSMRGNKAVHESARTERDILTLIQSAGGNPHIIQLHRVFYDSARMYLVMEYCPSGDLCTFIQKNIYVEDLADKFRQVVTGVSYLHEMGYAHRDLSLENVLIGADGLCKLCDFGLAVSVTRRDNKRLGKSRYMAPEIANPERRYSGVEADVWSLGIMLYVLLTAKFLFARPDESDEGFKLYCRDGLRALVKKYRLTDEIPPMAMDLLEQMLHLNPNQRPSVDDILAHPFLEPKPVLPVFKRCWSF